MRRTQTDNQVVHSCRLAMLGKTWRSLDDYEISSWITLFHQIPQGTPGSCPTPYLTFVAANIGIYAATGQILSTAPPRPIPPQTIVGPRLHAAHTDGAFTLALALPENYPDHLLVYAAPPVPFALDPFARPQSFRLIAALPAPDTHIDLTALYQARFRPRAAGSKIAVKLVGVSPSGQRTEEYCLSAVVNHPAC